MEVILCIRMPDGRAIEREASLHESGVIFVEPLDIPQDVAVFEKMPATLKVPENGCFITEVVERHLLNPQAGIIIVECSSDDLQASAVFEKIPEIPDLSELFITAGREMRPPLPPYKEQKTKCPRCVGKHVLYHRRMTRRHENYVAK
ncbi:MAG: hypothetical protein II085_03585 [Alphaproteobacteria bacterium]|nr:hypothetical protein [Alphaproteobacteria bacterium]